MESDSADVENDDVEEGGNTTVYPKETHGVFDDIHFR